MYFDLSYIHSALLDYEKSGLNVTLNDQPIGSIRLSDNSTRLSRTRIALPIDTLRAGNNNLLVQADMFPRTPCFDARKNNLWFSVRADSALHIPNGDVAAPVIQNSLRRANLADFPAPFVATPNLADTAFVVSEKDPVAWMNAVRIAAELGRRTDGSPVELALSFADTIAPELRLSHDLVIIGKASELTVTADLNAHLPAPFAAGSNIAEDVSTGVKYRTPSNADIGYLQIITSPWQSEHSILLITGNTDAGLTRATEALLAPEVRGGLTGNLTVVQDDQIQTSDTRLEKTVVQQPQAADASANTWSGAAAAPTVASGVTAPSTPGWVLPLVIGAIGILLLILIVSGIVVTVQKRREGPNLQSNWDTVKWDE